MLKLTKFFATAAFATTLITAPALAQDATPAAPAATTTPAVTTVDADPALWVVRDADTTIYLFGTVHLLRPGLSWFDDAVADAFNASEELVLEIDASAGSNAQALIAQYGIATDGATVSSRLTEADRATYVRAMDSVGLPAPAFERLEPWVPSLMLGIMPLVRRGYNPAEGVEAILSGAARTANKRVSALETEEQQIGFFDSLPMPAQVQYLNGSATLALSTEDMFEPLVQHWAAGRADELGTMMNGMMAPYPDVAAVLLTNRNERWATWIGEHIAQPGGTYFVAVGAGHLAGDNSVQAFLTRNGLTVTRVAY